MTFPAGLLGDPFAQADPQGMAQPPFPVAPPAPVKTSLLDRILNRIYNPGQLANFALSPGQVQSQQNQGLINTGLGLLAAGGPRPQGTSGGLADVAQAILQGRQGFQQDIEGAAKSAMALQSIQQSAERQAALKKLVDENQPVSRETPQETSARLARMISGGLRVGGEEGKQFVNEVTNALNALKDTRDPFIKIGPGEKLIDPVTRAVVAEGPPVTRNRDPNGREVLADKLEFAKKMMELGYEVTYDPEGNATLVPRTPGREAIPVEGGEGVGRVTPESAALTKAIAENERTVKSIQKAMKAAEDNPTAFGLINYLPQDVRQRDIPLVGDPESVDPLSLVANVGSLVRHDRFGSAQTLNETRTAKPFIPSGTDTPDKIVKNLQRLLEDVETETNELRKGLRRKGGGGGSDAKARAAARAALGGG